MLSNYSFCDQTLFGTSFSLWMIGKCALKRRKQEHSLPRLVLTAGRRHHPIIPEKYMHPDRIQNILSQGESEWLHKRSQTHLHFQY